MIYNTDYDQVQTYTQTAWSGITGSKDLGIECASAMDCASGFCVDNVCCNTSPVNCNGDCEACNLVGTMGVCTVRANLDNTEVTPTCYYCNGTSDTSLAYTGYTGVSCTGSNACFSGTCLASYCDEDNDTHFTKIVAQCPSNRYQATAGDDCDDSCATCYPGSISYTTSPDGKDQDCDGSIDETACIGRQICGNVGVSCDTTCQNLTDCVCSNYYTNYLYGNITCTGTMYGNMYCNKLEAGYYISCYCTIGKYH